jgi:catechol 2,3-dioxygenase-like lactoylglutathione lyase family enzyme
MQHRLRIARPVTDLARAKAMYCEGLGLHVLASFEDHEGFDGVMLGAVGSSHHFEFTRCRAHPVAPAPTPEDLAVFYVPDSNEWRGLCAAMLAAGFTEVESVNPYWRARGRTFEDPDGYRTVLQNDAWRNAIGEPD